VVKVGSKNTGDLIGHGHEEKDDNDYRCDILGCVLFGVAAGKNASMSRASENVLPSWKR
jgi:hypothetical protein